MSYFLPILDFVLFLGFIKVMRNMVYMSHAHALKTWYGRYLITGDRLFLRQSKMAKRVLDGAGISYAYKHPNKLDSGGTKTISIDLIDTACVNSMSTYGVYTEEMVLALFEDAKQVYKKRMLELFTLGYYRRLFFG
jgi:hypothetical protein